MNIFDIFDSIPGTPRPERTGPPPLQPTQRSILEQSLVSGAAPYIAEEPHRAEEISEAIKTVLDTLYPTP